MLCSLICVLLPYFIWEMICLPLNTWQMWCFQLWGYIVGTLYFVTTMGRYESHASCWSCWFSATTPWHSSRRGSHRSRDNREVLADRPKDTPIIFRDHGCLKTGIEKFVCQPTKKTSTSNWRLRRNKMEINISWQPKKKDALVSRAFQQLPICNYTIFCIATTNACQWGKKAISVVCPPNTAVHFPLKLAEIRRASLLQSIHQVKDNPNKHIHQAKESEGKRR